jgi:hypothetical protein
MSKPDITLEPSKGVVSEMASRIYAAYILHGDVTEGEEDQYMERAIRQAVRIAKTVERSVETEDAPSTGEDPPPPATKPRTSDAAEASRIESPSALSSEGSGAKSEIDAVIDEALLEQDTSGLQRKTG